METFIWKFHTMSIEHPEGDTMTLGNSYQYAAEPRSVDQRTFKLGFKTMKYFLNASQQIDLNAWPELNMARLYNFYLEHRMWKSFIYPNPTLGNLVCRFKAPLTVPAGLEGGNGAVQSFGIELIEQP